MKEVTDDMKCVLPFVTNGDSAVCNVALFKNMKEKQFREEIYVSYSDVGVILEASNEEEWLKANAYVHGFLDSKKIALLTYGYEKEAYEQLILQGLKQYTRRMKEEGEECPYINIIHYQKLRKSCEYMDKEKYVQPLRDWQRKNKTTPNFAFLIVQPPSKFEQVKVKLLEHLLKREVRLEHVLIDCMSYMLILFHSDIKNLVRDAIEHKLIQVCLEQVPKSKDNPQGYLVNMTNYTDLPLGSYDYKLISSSKNLLKLGLQCIAATAIQANASQMRQFVRFLNARGEDKIEEGETQKFVSSPGRVTLKRVKSQKNLKRQVNPFEQLHQRLSTELGQNYCAVQFVKSEKGKFEAIIDKFINRQYSKDLQELNRQIQKNIICSFQEIEFISESPCEKGYRQHKVCINDCPYMVHEYAHILISDIDTFLFYLEQLKTYYCGYLVRYYGLAIKYGELKHESTHKVKLVQNSQKSIEDEPNKVSSKGRKKNSKLQPNTKSRKFIQEGTNTVQSYNRSLSQRIEAHRYFLIFDYHHRTIEQMIECDFIQDNFQAGHIVLQLVYLINFLHTHEEPRCLGSAQIDEIYWPIAVVLPYLNNHKLAAQGGLENDVLLVGNLMKTLLNTDDSQKLQDDYFSSFLNSTLKESKYERISLAKCVTMLQELLLL